MKPTLPQPDPEQRRAMAALQKAQAWLGFWAWLDEATENAVQRVLTCESADLLDARSMASALTQIREVLETAPDVIRETDR